MDSDDDFGLLEDDGVGMSPDDGGALDGIDFKALLDGQLQSFESDGKGMQGEFDIPEIVSTAGYNANRTPKSLLNHHKTFERVRLKHFDEERHEILTTMVGDFSDLETLMEPVVEDGSLKKIILRGGTGRQVVENDLVSVHYILSIETMDDLLESTYVGNSVRRFRVGKGEVLMVLDRAVKTMRIGETSKFLGAPELAFGSLGVPLFNDTAVPGDCRALIQIEVMDARFAKKDDTILGMSTAERRELGFEELYAYALELKQEGNDEFSIEEFDLAAAKYKEALECIKDMSPLVAEERDKYLKLHYEILNNISMAFFKQNNFKLAHKLSKEATKVPMREGSKAKAFYRCAKASYELGHFEVCLDEVKKANALSGGDRNVKELLQMTEKRIKTSKEQEKLLCSRMVNASISA